jgi:hypothetical protein
MALSTFSSVRSAACASAWEALDVSGGMGCPDSRTATVQCDAKVVADEIGNVGKALIVAAAGHEWKGAECRRFSQHIRWDRWWYSRSRPRGLPKPARS